MGSHGHCSWAILAGLALTVACGNRAGSADAAGGRPGTIDGASGAGGSTAVDGGSRADGGIGGSAGRDARGGGSAGPDGGAGVASDVSLTTSDVQSSIDTSDGPRSSPDAPLVDGSGTDAQAVPGCADDKAPAEAFCDPARARPCQLSTGALCRCEGICSGARPPPGMEYTWACHPPAPAACPPGTPMQGAACAPEGLVCQYGTCGGSTARCALGKWMVTFVPPPP